MMPTSDGNNDLSNLSKDLVNKNEKTTTTFPSIAGTDLKDAIFRQKWYLLLSGLLSCFASALGLVPHYICYLISQKYFGSPPSSDNETSDHAAATRIPEPTRLAMWVTAAVIGKALCFGISIHLSHHAAFTILYDLRIIVARKFGRLNLGYFTARSTGELKKILHEDIEMLELGLVRNRQLAT